jgi:hypothetical protein
MPESEACAPSYSRPERMPRIGRAIAVARLSAVPVGAQICPYTREFGFSLNRAARTALDEPEGMRA